MKAILFALTGVSLLSVSCNKDDDDNAGGPKVEVPGIGLVAPDDFKNTAKNGAEVSTHLNQASQATGNVKFGNPSSGNVSSSGSALYGDAVNKFLTADEIGLPRDTSLSLSAGSDCAKELNTLNTVYSTTSSVLKQTAGVLAEFDSAQLPDGITKEPASEKFAVSYKVDLSKMNVRETSSSSSGSSQLPETPKTNLGGVALLGAGANADLAVLSLGINGVASSDDGQNASFAGGISIGAYSKLETLKLSNNSDISLVFKDNQGKSQSARASFSSAVTMVAGKTPSIGLSVTGKANGKFDPETNQVSPTSEEHAMAADIKVEKLANNDVGVTYSFKADDGEQKGNIVLTTDSFGRCVVKQPTTPSIASVK